MKTLHSCRCLLNRLLLLLLLILTVSISKTHGFSQMPPLRYTTTLSSTALQMERSTTGITRRTLFVASVPLLWTLLDSPSTCSATTGSIQTSQYSSKAAAPTTNKSSKISPQLAYTHIIQAREELQQAKTLFLSKRDFNVLRDYLANDATQIKDFETNALVILASKKLDDEDKKAIGTIRRYGAGADVIIMYGGLLTEIDEENEEPDYAAALKYLTRSIESLDEVIAICKNSGGFDGK